MSRITVTLRHHSRPVATGGARHVQTVASSDVSIVGTARGHCHWFNVVSQPVWVSSKTFTLSLTHLRRKSYKEQFPLLASHISIGTTTRRKETF